MSFLEITNEQAQWFRRRLIEWGRKNYDSLPWRSASLPIHQLIAEILLQRTRAEQVIPVYEKLVQTYPDLESIASASKGEISDIIQPLGLHWRAAFLHQMLRKVAEEFEGAVPEERASLLSLPGVGQYVANAYLSLHRGLRQPIVDSNVVRLYGRFFGFSFDGETRRKKWLLELAAALTPPRIFKDYNYAILDLARKACKKKPLCSECPLVLRCNEYHKQR